MNDNVVIAPPSTAADGYRVAARYRVDGVGQRRRRIVHTVGACPHVGRGRGGRGGVVDLACAPAIVAKPALNIDLAASDWLLGSSGEGGGDW